MTVSVRRGLVVMQKNALTPNAPNRIERMVTGRIQGGEQSKHRSLGMADQLNRVQPEVVQDGGQHLLVPPS